MEVGRGRNVQAIQVAERAVALLPLEKDAYFGTRELVGLAQIAAQANAPEQALRVIQQLLSIPAGGVMSVERLKLDPVWDPIRGDPRFQKLIADGEASQAQAQTKP